ncbi:hypothetical protein E2C01_016361 [Portunus trituberculatus]|uniref:Uncharacterized protein n=1 Tax=Portunus trituberculatus TaxID=210409 RepID=A0A5B7DQD1_PORTR|nr:hypothetical protein [Portunus trituberculatus]
MPPPFVVFGGGGGGVPRWAAVPGLPDDGGRDVESVCGVGRGDSTQGLVYWGETDQDRHRQRGLEFLTSPVDSLISPVDDEDDDDLPSNQDDDTNTQVRPAHFRSLSVSRTLHSTRADLKCSVMYNLRLMCMCLPCAAQSPESSCVSAQDNWETGGESDGRAIYAPEVDTHEERRFSERFFPRNFPPPSRRNRRRTKKRHHVHSPQYFLMVPVLMFSKYTTPHSIIFLVLEGLSRWDAGR